MDTCGLIVELRQTTVFSKRRLSSVDTVAVTIYLAFFLLSMLYNLFHNVLYSVNWRGLSGCKMCSTRERDICLCQLDSSCQETLPFSRRLYLIVRSTETNKTFFINAWMCIWPCVRVQVNKYLPQGYKYLFVYICSLLLFLSFFMSISMCICISVTLSFFQVYVCICTPVTLWSFQAKCKSAIMFVACIYVYMHMRDLVFVPSGKICI